MGYYAVRIGRKRGVYSTWWECEAQIRGFANPIFKKFIDEAGAEAFVNGILPARLRVQDGEEYDEVFCTGTGDGSKDTVAGIGVWWGKDHPPNISERCPGAQTQNRPSLIAIVRVLETAPPHTKTLVIKTDSLYSVRCFHEFIEKWKSNGWRKADNTPVKNPEIIRYIDAHIAARKQKGQKVVLEHLSEDSEAAHAAWALATKGEIRPELPERDWESLLKDLENEQEDGLGRAVSDIR